MIEKYKLKFAEVWIDFKVAEIQAIYLNGVNIIVGHTPLFEAKLRGRNAKSDVITSDDCRLVSYCDGIARYTHEKADFLLLVRCQDGKLYFNIAVENKTDFALEWVGLMSFGVLEKLREEVGGRGEIVYPYNEGCLVTDMSKCDGSWLKYYEPEYPSIGLYSIFPNMICSQFLAYGVNGCGIYLGLHDSERTTKQIDFSHIDGKINLILRTYCDADYGQSYDMPFDFVMDSYRGEWQDACEIYRRWFERNKPSGVKRISENTELPEWYAQSPIVVTYPVRGHFDTDKMYENRMYPYENALSELENIASATKSRVMTLLMHWEGTAPWAPPYVWPPYGGEQMFGGFVKSAHEKNLLVGLYCSGMGWTQKSNILPSYDKTDEFERDKLSEIMCSDSDGRIEGKICTGQRSGFDLCPACGKTREILANELEKVSKSGVDYVQAFDQNHGGNSYFCYSDKHGHTPAPGKWQTQSVSRLLDEMMAKAGRKLLFGCESAASEPFIGRLQFSDNRFELNYFIGSPIPVYSYIYHEYLNNFMGNQVCMELSQEDINYPYRVAYSFIAGDMLTAVIDDAGNIAYCWGNDSFNRHTDKSDALKILGNLNGWRTGIGKSYLHTGRMVKPMPIESGENIFKIGNGFEHKPGKILTSAYEYEGKTAQFAVNYNKEEIEISLPEICDVYFDGRSDACEKLLKTVKIPPLSAVMLIKSNE